MDVQVCTLILTFVKTQVPSAVIGELPNFDGSPECSTGSKIYKEIATMTTSQPL